MEFMIADDVGLCRSDEFTDSSLMVGGVWGFNGYAYGAACTFYCTAVYYCVCYGSGSGLCFGFSEIIGNVAGSCRIIQSGTDDFMAYA